jgi:hypothetical protein
MLEGDAIKIVLALRKEGCNRVDTDMYVRRSANKSVHRLAKLAIAQSFDHEWKEDFISYISDYVLTKQESTNNNLLFHQ